jgi:hypothetical protein
LSFLGLAHEPVEQFEAATVGARAALVSIEHTRYESVDQQAGLSRSGAPLMSRVGSHFK